MTKTLFSWFAINEAMQEGGFRAETPEAWEAEKVELTKLGAPDVEQLELVSYLADSWEDVIIEAQATPAFIKWATTDNENGESNLVYYTN